MCWIKIALMCLLVPLLHAHKDCTQMIRWDNLLKDLNSLSSRISYDCGHHYDKTRLCDPQQMLSMMELNANTVFDIMWRAESIYKHKSQDFVSELIHAQNSLVSCVHPTHRPKCEPVETCFNKLQDFLDNKKGHLQCAWEIVNAKTREIIQRLENRTVRRRRSAQSRVFD